MFDLKMLGALVGVDKAALREMAEDALQAEVKKRFAAKLSAAAKPITRKLRREKADVQDPAAIRKALFFAWKEIVRAGPVADVARDLQDDKILARVSPQVTAETKLPQLVALVIAETVELTF